MSEEDVIPPFWELDYCDLTLYQHPPCMFILWYLALAVNKIVPFIKDLLEGKGSEGGDGDDAGGKPAADDAEGSDEESDNDAGDGGDAGHAGEGEEEEGAE